MRAAGRLAGPPGQVAAVVEGVAAAGQGLVGPVAAVAVEAARCDTRTSGDGGGGDGGACSRWVSASPRTLTSGLVPLILLSNC